MSLSVFVWPQPGRANSPILCHIRRTKQGMYPRYHLFLGGTAEPDGDNASEGERFMLSARKRKKSKSSNYLISLDEEDMSRQVRPGPVPLGRSDGSTWMS
eukprot:2052139-Pyramimonas_sp.AAC.1